MGIIVDLFAGGGTSQGIFDALGGITGYLVGDLKRFNNAKRVGVGAVLRESSVRRLLPLKCELLIGLPPGYTLIPSGRAVKPEKMEQDLTAFLLQHGCLTFEDPCRAAADGPRYKSHGNSIAIPLLRWLGHTLKKSCCLSSIPTSSA